jgi:ACR3 family arsenite efflux pump ArsB
MDKITFTMLDIANSFEEELAYNIYELSKPICIVVILLIFAVIIIIKIKKKVDEENRNNKDSKG